ncbi:hypothetical protein [Streptomyces albipurpureus]|uniref:Integral membrane protein n=1 Tax=Streptomyces albipurpureus TaxID=2897419 RepID=A0ABT0UJE8_9ACTN|nr:hypothetical protein [Streptomyces sp. CWNU-1]MCM2388774.1 hypothetical protein [Streptomyces sp. CWNU-1]
MGLTTTLQVMLSAGQTAEANDFSDWTCKNVPFADKVCGVVESTNKAVDFMSDPLGYIAQFFNNAVTSLFTQMIKALLSTTSIDWQDPGFLRAYSMAFAASTVLTIILWLLAVAKRAVQGVPPLQALGESIGFLLISVTVSALAPAGIAYTVKLFDEAAEAMLMPVASDAADMVFTVTTAMGVLMSIPGGSILVIFLALSLLTAIAGVWLELIVRNALILAGLVLGTSVFSGLVDRSLWNHVKRWVGVMCGIIASKYVLFTTLNLASGMLVSDASSPSVTQSFATAFTAIALFWLALYLPFQLAKFLPLVGDEIQGMHQAKEGMKGSAQNVGSQMGDSFGELKSRFGGGSGGGGEGGDSGEGGESLGGGGSEAEVAEAGAAATGVGAAAVAAKKGVDSAKEQGEQAVEQGVDAASGSADGASGTPDTSAGNAGDKTSGGGSGSGAASGSDSTSPAGGEAAAGEESSAAPVGGGNGATAAGGDAEPAPPSSWPPAEMPPEQPSDDLPPADEDPR